MKFRKEPLFRALLGRNLSAETRSAAIAQLFQAGPNYPEKLALFARLSDHALAEEVGPPPSGIITWIPLYYTVYEVPKKLLQKREPTKLELVFAAVDPLFLIYDMAGGQPVRRALVLGGTAAASGKLAQKGGEKLLVSSVRDLGLELARKKLGKEVVEKVTEKELADWITTGAISETQKTMRSAMSKGLTVEITGSLQFMHRMSGLHRPQSRHLKGLQARLYLRGNSKGYVRLVDLTSGAAVGSRTAAFFVRTSQDLALGAVIESEPGQKALEEVTRQVLDVKDQLQQWAKNVSAWWLLHASWNFESEDERKR